MLACPKRNVRVKIRFGHGMRTVNEVAYFVLVRINPLSTSEQFGPAIIVIDTNGNAISRIEAFFQRKRICHFRFFLYCGNKPCWVMEVC